MTGSSLGMKSKLGVKGEEYTELNEDYRRDWLQARSRAVSLPCPHGSCVGEYMGLEEYDASCLGPCLWYVACMILGTLW